MNLPLLTWSLAAVQVAYLLPLLVTLWLSLKPVNAVDRSAPLPDRPPAIVLLYPVLQELEATMRTTLTSIARAPYPEGLLRVVAIPNSDDHESITALEVLQWDFDFLEIMLVPPTSHPSWDAVWNAWDANEKAYWWHEGERAGDRDLPPKKTRQLIWATYRLAPQHSDALLSYIDADSAVPPDYWRTAAVGMQTFDVIQNTNITGNPLSSWPASFYAMDHMSWDSALYRHMSADGRHPYWVLGKGLFFRFEDLVELGGFHPWLAIEDPEVGMRMWTNGRRLGIVESPLIEEVPETWAHGIIQRKRWVAGFFQSLGRPLKAMGMRPADRWRARMNLVPCLSLMINPVGLLVGVAALLAAVVPGAPSLPLPVTLLSLGTMAISAWVVLRRWFSAWRLLDAVEPHRRRRLVYLLRVNPLLMLGYWTWWAIPIVIGMRMWLQDGGLVWERTEKRNANRALVLEGPDLVARDLDGR